MFATESFRARVCVCVCVCEREREKEIEIGIRVAKIDLFLRPFPCVTTSLVF